jgi:hypothetical protein
MSAWVARHANKLIREAVKIIPHGNVATEEGIYKDLLDRELGVEIHKALCADTADVVLETIYYCQTELASVSEALYESRIRLNPDLDRNEEVSPAASITATYIHRSCMHVLALIIFL